MKTSNTRSKILASLPPAVVAGGIIFLAAIAMIGIWQWAGEDSSQAMTNAAKPTQPVLPVPKSQMQNSSSSAQGSADTASAVAVKELNSKLQRFVAQFMALPKQHGGTESKAFHFAAVKALADLRATLHAAPPEVAAAAIKTYLDTKEDTSTGLTFFVGGEGDLPEASTIRTALLDAISEVDPAASVASARQVLAQSQSPEEWALALRNLARQNQDDSHTEELRQALGKMLDNQQWLANTPGAFLEAFDVAVALGGPAEIQSMASVLHLEDVHGEEVMNGVSTAAFDALERMTYRNPAQTVKQFDATPDLLAWAPEQRGSLMARAELGDPAQRAIVEKYLLRTDLTAAEVASFASSFPNRSLVLGNALVSNTTGIGVDTAADSTTDQAAVLAIVQQWQQNPRFQARQAELDQIAMRLAEDSTSGRPVLRADHSALPSKPFGK